VDSKEQRGMLKWRYHSIKGTRESFIIYLKFTSLRPSGNQMFCSSSRKAKILTAPYDLPDLLGRCPYIEYFEDSLAKVRW